MARTLTVMSWVARGCLAVATLVIVNATLDDARAISEEQRTIIVTGGTFATFGGEGPDEFTIACDALTGERAFTSETVNLGSPYSDDTTLYGLMSDEDFAFYAASTANDRYPGEAGKPTLGDIRRAVRADLSFLCQQERNRQQTAVLRALGGGALKLGIVAALAALLGPTPWRRRQQSPPTANEADTITGSAPTSEVDQ